jgi:hypothetical protein
VEPHLVDPVAVAVVGRQLRVVLVRQDAVLARLGRPASEPSGDQVVDDLGDACRVTASTSARRR